MEAGSSNGTRVKVLILALCSQLTAIAASSLLDVRDIVARSVANNQTDWKAAPGFSFTERDINGKGSSHKYRVIMIDGSPYNETIAIGGQPLSAQAQAAEDEKLRREQWKRQHESTDARAKRIAEYEKGRRQDHALMQEMIAAFAFHLEGTESLDGRTCYKISASPNPAYVPKSRETQVLKGMRGTLWIDSKTYQWVQVQAAVFRPVTFGLFVAHVEPGTSFLLREAPVEGNIWMPTYFETRVNAKVLFFGYNSLEQETYSDYKRIPTLITKR